MLTPGRNDCNFNFVHFHLKADLDSREEKVISAMARIARDLQQLCVSEGENLAERGAIQAAPEVECEVAEIRAWRRCGNNEREFLIRWEDYPPENDEWVKESAMSCKDHIETFFATNPDEYLENIVDVDTEVKWDKYPSSENTLELKETFLDSDPRSHINFCYRRFLYGPNFEDSNSDSDYEARGKLQEQEANKLFNEIEKIKREPKKKAVRLRNTWPKSCRKNQMHRTRNHRSLRVRVLH